MLSLSSAARYFLYDQPTDMRCGVYSLAGLVTNKLGKDVLSGDIFIFIGKSANQIRLLQLTTRCSGLPRPGNWIFSPWAPLPTWPMRRKKS